MFPSKNLIVLALTFRSLVHFEFFGCGLSEGVTVILLHVDIQLSQHHLLIRLSFSIELFWHHWQKSIDQECEIFFVNSQFFSIDLEGLSLCQFIPS